MRCFVGKNVAEDCHSLWRPRASGLGHHRHEGDPNRAAQVFSALVLALPVGVVRGRRQCRFCRPGQGRLPLRSGDREVKCRRRSSNLGGQIQVCRPPPILCSRILEDRGRKIQGISSSGVHESLGFLRGGIHDHHRTLDVASLGDARSPTISQRMRAERYAR